MNFLTTPSHNILITSFCTVCSLLACPLYGKSPHPSANQHKLKQVIKMYKDYRKELGGMPEKTPAEVDRWLKKLNAAAGHGSEKNPPPAAHPPQSPAIVLVDHRDPKEWRVSMIPGAIPSAKFLKVKKRFTNSIIIVYCTIGYRSGKLVNKLRTQNFRAFNLTGGILQWIHAGFPLVDQKGNHIKLVHVYGKTWDLAPAGYKTVW